MHQPDIDNWLQQNLNALLLEYGLVGWTVRYDFSHEESEGWAARCTPYHHYRKGYIRINMPEFISKDEWYLEKIIRHEIGHLLHAPFTNYYRLVMEAIEPISGSESILNVLAEAFNHAQEDTVWNIEQMHKAHVEKYSSHD